jgi:flagellar basal-body rod protein FlgB
MNTPPILAGIRERMQNLSERQRVVATNIANSETPGYKALVGGSGMIAAPRVQLTDRMKSLGAIQPVGAGLILDKDITETKPDGNNVTLEDQLLKMGEIQADFQAMTGLYRKQMSMLKTAVGGRG